MMIIIVYVLMIIMVCCFITEDKAEILLYKHIIEVTEGKRLLMNSYSAKLFSEKQKEHIIAQCDFLEIASEK